MIIHHKDIKYFLMMLNQMIKAKQLDNTTLHNKNVAKEAIRECLHSRCTSYMVMPMMLPPSSWKYNAITIKLSCTLNTIMNALQIDHNCQTIMYIHYQMDIGGYVLLPHVMSLTPLRKYCTTLVNWVSLSQLLLPFLTFIGHKLYLSV